jgi:hypothetical protein
MKTIKKIGNRYPEKLVNLKNFDFINEEMYKHACIKYFRLSSFLHL